MNNLTEEERWKILEKIFIIIEKQSELIREKDPKRMALRELGYIPTGFGGIWQNGESKIRADFSNNKTILTPIN